jgi:hypothetical protein
MQARDPSVEDFFRTRTDGCLYMRAHIAQAHPKPQLKCVLGVIYTVIRR